MTRKLVDEEQNAGRVEGRLRAARQRAFVGRKEELAAFDEALSSGGRVLSMRAGLNAFSALAGGRRTIAVLGAMGQQADASRARHEQLGRLVAELGIDVLIAVGDDDPQAMARQASGAGVAVHTVEDVAGAVSVASELIEAGDVVFVKASSEYGLGACARQLAAH